MDIEIVAASFIASLMVTFSLLWKSAGGPKVLAVTLGVALVCAFMLAWMFQQLYPEASLARSAARPVWLVAGAGAAIGGPVIGSLLAWYSRRRFAQFRAMAGRNPHGDGI